MKATTAELSTPPERKAPSGTSATMRERTASRSRSTISSSSALTGLRTGLEKSTSHHCTGARHRAAAADQEKMAGGELPDALDDRGVVGDVAVSEKSSIAWRIGVAAQQRVGEQALQLRGEDQGAVGQLGVEERLHAEPVAGEEQRVLGGVVEGEGEHAVEPREAVRPPLPPGGEDHLGVALGAEAWPLASSSARTSRKL